MYSVYVLRSEKVEKYYIGYTSNLDQRLSKHNSGSNKSTRFGRPWKVVYKEDSPDKKSAWLRERQIKSYKGGGAFKKLLV